MRTERVNVSHLPLQISNSKSTILIRKLRRELSTRGPLVIDAMSG
jgi:hypothetical protein